jgi:hypothetical protein
MAECRNDSRRNVNAANEHIFEQIVCRTVSQSKRRSGNSLKAAAKNNENVNAAPTVCEFAACERGFVSKPCMLLIGAQRQRNNLIVRICRWVLHDGSAPLGFSTPGPERIYHSITSVFIEQVVPPPRTLYSSLLSSVLLMTVIYI